MMATRQHFSALVTSASMAREILLAGFRTLILMNFFSIIKCKNQRTSLFKSVCLSVLSCPVLSIGLSACLPIYLSKSNLI